MKPKTLFCTARRPGSSSDLNATYQCMQSALIVQVEPGGRIILKCSTCKTQYNLEALAVENGVALQGVVTTADDFAAAHGAYPEAERDQDAGKLVEENEWMF